MQGRLLELAYMYSATIEIVCIDLNFLSLQIALMDHMPRKVKTRNPVYTGDMTLDTTPGADLGSSLCR